jgi:hypothetical protein
LQEPLAIAPHNIRNNSQKGFPAATDLKTQLEKSKQVVAKYNVEKYSSNSKTQQF